MAEELKKEIKEAQKKLEQVKKEHEQVLASIQSSKLEHEALVLENKQLEDSITHNTKAIKDHVKVREENEKILDTQQTRKRELTKDVNGLETRKKSLAHEIDDFEKTVKLNEENAKKRLAEQFKDATGKLSQVLSQIEDEEKRLAILREGTKKEVADQKDLVAKIEQLGKDMDAMKRQKADVERDLKLVQKEVQKAQDVVDNLKGQKDVLDEQIVTNKSMVAQLETSKKELTDDVTDLQAKIDGKKQEYTEAESKLFGIAEREQALAGREEFIKAKFKQAGIPYR